MLSGEFFRFEAGSLVACNEIVGEVRLAAADSWLVEDGRSRSIQAHFDRFAGWVSKECPVLAKDLPQFFEKVIAAIPVNGRWFPRIELHLETGSLVDSNIDEMLPALYLRLREAPEQAGGIRLWTLKESDPRSNPLVKGPDLSLGMQLRRKAILHDADEAVLLSPDGFIAEGALSSIVWWRRAGFGGAVTDTLCAPDDSVPWLHSITRDEVFSIATGMGFKTRVERAKPSDLVGLEIWALSSLHGIRPVVDWVNLGSPVGQIRHAEAFQKRLRLLSAQIA